jgi:hypothetical protein
MSTNTGCCGGTTATCDSTIAELPRYYPRQLITPDDLTLEQNYFRDRMRRHNRLLHGWGVVCGAIVCPATTTNSDGTTSFTPWQVKVQKGYVLGPYGDEIIVDCCRTVDLRTAGVTGVTGQPCIDAPDPWCSQIFTPPSTTNVLYIAVQYNQSMMRPVRVQPVGCGCDGTSCEYSRWHDGYQIGVLTSCPACNACDPNETAPDKETLGGGAIPTCPDCSCGPWVCLAQVTLASDGTIQQIDNSSCRRMVLSLGNYWWLSSGNASGATATSVSAVVNPANPATTPPQITAGGSAVPLAVQGANLEIGSSLPSGPQPTYSFGSGIAVSVSGQTNALLTGQASVSINVTALAGASPGIYNLTVVNADCSVVVFGNAIQVVAPGTPSALVAAPTPPPTTNLGGNTARSAGAAARPAAAQRAAVASSAAGAPPSPKAAAKAKQASGATQGT